MILVNFCCGRATIDRQSQMLKMSSVATGTLSSVELGQMSVVEQGRLVRQGAALSHYYTSTGYDLSIVEAG